MSSQKHILIVEDELHLAIGIKYNLEAEGYRVSTTGDAPSALKLITDPGQQIDLVILDVMLPGMSGYTLCQTLRDSGSELPILILSARTLAEDRTRGFDVGANQYMTKPFELDELLSRVKNLLAMKRPSGESARPRTIKPRIYEFDKAKIDFERFEVSVRGKPVRLTALQMKLLQYFIDNEGRVIPRHELLENVWDMPGNIQSRAPDQFISQLRKVFEVNPAKPRHFITVRDAGYRFLANPED